MANWETDARRAAERFGLDPDVFVAQMGQEAHGDDLTSPAGALGPAQFMPGTARGVGLNSTTVHQRVPAYNAAAKLMAGYVKDYGSVRNALVAYNAGPGRVGKPLFSETANYVKTILNGHNPGAASSPSPSGRTSAAGAAEQVASPAPTLQSGQGGDYVSLLTGLLGQQQPQQPTSAGLAPPGFMSRLAQPQGFRPIDGSGAPQQQAPSADLSLLETLRGSGTGVEPGTPVATAKAPGVLEQVLEERRQAKITGIPPLGGRKNADKGVFKIDGPKPERLQRGLVSYADKVAEIYGGTLEGKDGSTHSKYTVNGNVSEHFTGRATDIFRIDGKPATGARLIRAGRAALIAAGMPREEALKAPGGLYNVGNHQIIFGVNGKQYGGDHTDHLHISTHAE